MQSVEHQQHIREYVSIEVLQSGYERTRQMKPFERKLIEAGQQLQKY